MNKINVWKNKTKISEEDEQKIKLKREIISQFPATVIVLNI